MFQLIGSLLAFTAILSALVGAPVVGTVLAFCTFMWVVVAKPREARPLQDDAPWGAVYQMPANR
ncbi:hypothetical protein BH11PSE3_BH11PSE3_35790 [soil metagenome]